MKLRIVIPKKPDLEVLCIPTDAVLTLKNEIYRAHGLFSNFYTLSFNGQELDSDLRMLKDYGIEDGSVIKLAHWNEPANAEMKFLQFKYNCEWRHSSENSINFSFVATCLCFRLFFTQNQSLIVCVLLSVRCTAMRQFIYLFSLLSSFSLRSATE